MNEHSYPYPGTGKTKLPTPRRPRTNSERKQWDALYGRKKRSPDRLRNWDWDAPIWACNRSWKHYRSTQHRPVKMA